MKNKTLKIIIIVFVSLLAYAIFSDWEGFKAGLMGSTYLQTKN